ncbi:arylsulfatase B-like [Saccoglossus kowalevskii]|uniref:Arylsulfatase B-like n=1 Tax=Saccoglossus kowalevskii TaxID=10224 RepID=A0ABM0GXP5_SACKO|nr:PREDICTED: arylsulfatase B-like [Saccoglossus kowalevskii]
MDTVSFYIAFIAGILTILPIAGAPFGTRPNIVFILADDLGWHDVGYHDSIIRTPNIDKLAAEGVKLENYYVTPLCTPTRAVLMTGRYQIHTGMQHGVLMAQEPRCLPTDEVLMPQKLKESGYTTHMVGKWHLGFYKWACTPNHRGFDTFFGMYLAGGDYFNHTRLCHGRRLAAWDLRDGDQVVAPEYVGKYSTIVFAEKAQEIIKKHDPTNPLFLYLSFQAVHAPLQVPERYINMYKDDIRDESRRIYAGMTTCMDEAIGNVTRTLARRGLLDNTIIVFSSDNGGAKLYGASNYPLRGQKGTLYEGGVRAPAFVYSPLLSNRVRGTATHELMYVGDWFPTFLHLAGGNLHGVKPLDGVNQWHTVSAAMPSKRTEIVHNIEPLRGKPPRVKDEPWLTNPYFDIRVMASIRVGEWKLITGRKGDPTWTIPPELGGGSVDPGRPTIVELYHIKEDPLERTDLSRDRPDIVNKLLERLRYHSDTSRLPETPTPVFDTSDPLHHNMAWGPWE